MRIDFTELEIEKKARIEAQIELLKEQNMRLVAERNALAQSILSRAKVGKEQNVTIFDTYAEAEEKTGVDGEE